MKTNNFFRKMMIAPIGLALLSAVAFSSCSKDDDDDMETNYVISGNANGTQVAPSNNSTGTGTITGTYNPNNRLLTYATTWSALSSAPVNGGFYIGASGAAGTAAGTPWTFASGTTATGTTSGSLTLTEAQEADLLAGRWYYSFGTTSRTNGEIRGQIIATR